jgi:hypothetical protein
MRFLCALLMATAVAAASDDQPTVEVFLPRIPSANLDAALSGARAITAQIYAEIGVRLIWRSTVSTPPRCSEEGSDRKIVMALKARIPNGISDTALAYAVPHQAHGPCVMLLEEPLLTAVRVNPTSTMHLLGHVLAHEIGHVLQGVSHHSDTGVMKSRWSLGEVGDMRKVRLHFTAWDQELILERLRGRPTLRAGASLPVGRNLR